jgi:rhodanese-related sulfurtransferase
MNPDFIDVAQAKSKLENDQCIVLDVRERSEFTSEHIAESHHAPLTRFDEEASKLQKNKTYLILCQSGNRACKAANTLHEMGFDHFQVIEGGLAAWKAQGHDTVKGTSQTWSLERQVRLTAGFLVFTGIVLGSLVHPYFYGLSGFIAVGLMFSAVTNTCGMGMMLAKMPWNQ